MLNSENRYFNNPLKLDYFDIYKGYKSSSITFNSFIFLRIALIVINKNLNRLDGF